MEKFKRFKAQKTSEKIFTVLLTILLFAFLGLVFYVNLSCNPEYYDGDIYADIQYAKEAWKAKSLFPSNWIFGNQTYVVATPVLAALIYGIIGNAITAMAIASCIMTVLVVITYDFMTRTLFSFNERLSGLLVMVGVIIFKAHIASAQKGGQVYFTMASYYSCYLITAFIVYGCYIRLRYKKINKKQLPMIIISLFLSFATGMQSLRQTVIMVFPLTIYEILCVIFNSVKQKKFFLTHSSFFSIGVAISNFIGLIAMKMIDIEQNKLYDVATLSFEAKQFVSHFIDTFIYKIVGGLTIEKYGVIGNVIFPALILLLIFIATIISISMLIKSHFNDSKLFCIAFLLILSCAGVFAVDILTNGSCKTIYFFMIFPLLAVSIATICNVNKKLSQILTIVIIFCFSFLIFSQSSMVYNEIKKQKNENADSYEIANYMLENDYDTLVSRFGLGENVQGGEDVVIASNDKIDLIQIKIDEDNGVCLIPYLHTKNNLVKNNNRTLYLFEADDFVKIDNFYKKQEIEFKIVSRYGNRILCKAPENFYINTID